MKFEENTSVKKIGEEIGFLLGFLIFSSMLFLILNLLNRIPLSIKYGQIIIVVFAIYIIKLIYKLVIK